MLPSAMALLAVFPVLLSAGVQCDVLTGQTADIDIASTGDNHASLPVFQPKPWSKTRLIQTRGDTIVTPDIRPVWWQTIRHVMTFQAISPPAWHIVVFDHGQFSVTTLVTSYSLFPLPLIS